MLRGCDLTTCLSPRYARLFAFRGSLPAVKSRKFLTERLTFNFTELHITSRMKLDSEEESRWYESFVKNLTPFIDCIGDIFANISSKQFGECSDLLLWTHNSEYFFKCFDLIKNGSIPLGIQFLTAIIERTIGNLTLMKTSKVPTLLKDLLALTELTELVGEEIVTLLQAIIGTPLALNVRNILWHGFMSPHEISSKYGYFLFVIVLSIGEILEAKGIKPSEIPQRPLIRFEATVCWDGVFPKVDSCNVDIVTEIILKSDTILPFMKAYWLEAIKWHKKGLYSECVVLLLPQLESLLRVFFAKVNNCPERILTAESDTLFITFTEILAQKLPDESHNKVVGVLNEQFMEVLFDLLINPEGPRIRDRLSHGEADFDSVSYLVSNHVINVCISLLCHHQSEISSPSSVVKVFSNELLNCVAQYQPFFHPFAILKANLIKFIQEFQESKELGFVSVADQTSFINLNIDETLIQLVESSCFVTNVMQIARSITFKSLYRPRFENEVCTLLRQIVNHSQSSLVNIFGALQLRQTLLSERRLRSRQRQNFERLVSCFPVMEKGLKLTAVFVLCLFKNINSVSFLDGSQQGKLVKFLRIILQYSENIDSLTGGDKNRWEEASSLTRKFLQDEHRLRENLCASMTLFSLRKL